MKVASVFDLKNVDENIFRLWIKSIPVNFSETLIRRLWKESKEAKSILWTKYEGFVIIEE